MEKYMQLHNKAIAETIAEMLKAKGARNVRVTEHPAISVFIVRWEQPEACENAS